MTMQKTSVKQMPEPASEGADEAREQDYSAAQGLLAKMEHQAQLEADRRHYMNFDALQARWLLHNY
jgi:hypothetical protein